MDVSIIIFYKENRGWLDECIKAAQDQVFNGEFEIIIQQGNYGASKNYNDGIKKAKGKYIRGCAEDDLLMPNCIQDLYDFAESGNYDIVCANAYNMRNGSNELYKSVIPQTISMLAEQNTIHGGTTMYKKQSIVDINLFNESLWTGEEFDLMLRMADNGYKFGYINKEVFYYRIWDGMKSMQAAIYSGEEYLKRKRYIRDVIRMKYLNNHKVIKR